MGIRNTSDQIINGEVWVDELRLSGVKKDRGVAMRMQSSLKLADLGTANFTYSRQDADFHRLQERLSKGTSTAENFNISGRLDLHRFLPRSWGFSLPVNASITRATNTPKYFPGEDILVDQNAPPDTIIAQSQSISFSTSLNTLSIILKQTLVLHNLSHQILHIFKNGRNHIQVRLVIVFHLGVIIILVH